MSKLGLDFYDQIGRESPEIERVSQCRSCLCMTHTYNGVCGKCGATKTEAKRHGTGYNEDHKCGDVCLTVIAIRNASIDDGVKILKRYMQLNSTQVMPPIIWKEK